MNSTYFPLFSENTDAFARVCVSDSFAQGAIDLEDVYGRFKACVILFHCSVFIVLCENSLTVGTGGGLYLMLLNCLSEF